MAKLHNVFDRRTGYFVVAKPAGWFDKHPDGEGNGKTFVIVESDKPLMNLTLAKLKQHDYSCKLDLIALAALEKANTVVSPLKNVVADKALALVVGSQKDRDEKYAALDTRQNATLTIGTDKTYATISAALAAASAGDCLEAYATRSNTYTEAVSITTNVTLRGMVGTRGITITYNSGSTVNVTTVSTGVCISNFKIVTTSNSGIAANCGGALLYTRPVYRCCHMYNGSGSAGTTIGLNSLSTGVGVPIAENCLIEGFAVGAYGSATRHVCTIHCTIVKCTTGMDANTATNAHAIATIAAGCTTAFNNLRTTTSLYAVSDDGTAAGIAAATGFATTDFTDYAGGDYTLKASVKATTAARFYGYPWLRGDGQENTRRRSGYFYAGFSDPDPGYIPVAAEVLSSVTAYGLDNELAGSATGEAHTADQVLKSAGGNWNDDNLGVGDEDNVADGVAFGLSQEGTLEAGEYIGGGSATTSKSVPGERRSAVGERT